ncbi:hypothetical protein MMC29_003177 [Sticta canariensis]|nr:hypothetical protein [Sticta canariensis]
MKDSDRKTIFLTGAPLSSSLQWDDCLLSAPLQACFAPDPKLSEISLSSSAGTGPTWRSLPFEREHLPTGITQLAKAEKVVGDHGDFANETSFLVARDLSFNSTTSSENSNKESPSPPPDEDLLTQFYDHSFAIHEEITSPRALDNESSHETSNSTSFEDSYIPSQLNDVSSAGKNLSKSRLSSTSITDLARVPKADYLEAITPQTMTVNLVLGIILVPQPRVIKARGSGQKLGLVEMLVGDETKAGFGISIWFSDPGNPNEKESDLQAEVAHLRPQDIVLARNIALSSFNGKVYGQSLRRDTTTLNLLYRNKVDATDKAGAFGARELQDSGSSNVQVSKLKRVRQWVMDFVGAGTILPQPSLTKKPSTNQKHQFQDLPPDTQ